YIHPLALNDALPISIEPIANALLKLPGGSVALVGANSDNIYGILNKLGVPVAAAGQTCPMGSMCVPCITNEWYPGAEYDRLWYRSEEHTAELQSRGH